VKFSNKIPTKTRRKKKKKQTNKQKILKWKNKLETNDLEGKTIDFEL
jgi:hypothetical protein